MSSASSTYTAFNVTTTTAVFTPSTIIGLVLLVVLTVLAFGAILVTRVRRYRHRSQATRARLHHVKEAYFEVVDPASSLDRSASVWIRLTGRFSGTSSREREPELPWPVYTVLPHLRPKAPLYARVLKTVMFWRRDEVKREPITVADVQRAIEQHAAAQARSTLSTGIGEEFKRTQSRRTSSSGCGRVDVPEIVIHPCDGSPAFSLVDEFTHPLIPCHIPSINVQSPPSWESFSPASTASEPDSPMPATPASESAAFPAILSATSPLDSLEVPMPVTTAPKLAEEMIVNVSSFSGKAFVLGRPPKKFVSATARGPRPVPPTTSNVGLGICICSPGAAIVIREPCLPDRNGDSIKDGKDSMLTPSSSASSTSSVPNILSILDEVALDPPQPRAGSLSPRQQVRKKLPSISGSSRKPVRVFEAIKFESLSFESESAGFRPLPNSRSTYYGILDSYGCDGDGD
ncbi:hypothetical protein L227DRAFT_616564 [Lentinus tigrinus ALCF2SS1-6]|uniref:Uncharacterized protein n=1 Tax=Lentinus tigrinus ALCF2SS1-6 TaxID=1328759 RepID=A0A5C2RTW5_9APHY|nr:hypothetical protein L227DRAFT_616564 [Lentinus tigrinus ALCF2SS1-6]